MTLAEPLPNEDRGRFEGSGRLVLVRHGRSTWNAAHRFTGWADPELDELGALQVAGLARHLNVGGLAPDVVLTSRLLRARTSAELLATALGQPPVVSDWRLNERHYGRLQGMTHDAARTVYGAEAVHRWRYGVHDRPPELTNHDRRHPRLDPVYGDVDPASLPAAESLDDALTRSLPALLEHALPGLVGGGIVLVVGHANLLRALLGHLGALDDAAVEHLEVFSGSVHLVSQEALCSLRSTPSAADDPPTIVEDQGGRHPRLTRARAVAYRAGGPPGADAPTVL